MGRGAIIGLLAAALGGAGPAATDDNPVLHACSGVKPIATDIKDPKWERWPSANDMAEYYPSVALSPSATEGKSVMRCRVRASGTLADCTVLCEWPANLGFGRATLHLARDFKLDPVLPDGRSPEGRTVVVRIHWKT
jgi:hypothetical protein